MKSFFATSALLALSSSSSNSVTQASAAAATALSPSDFEVTALPGLTDTLNFTQYAGYMPIGDAEGTELFFWFVESQRAPSQDPLVLWMNGGPGSSSVAYGFWTEHGPFRLQDDGKGNFKPELYEHSWCVERQRQRRRNRDRATRQRHRHRHRQRQRQSNETDTETEQRDRDRATRLQREPRELKGKRTTRHQRTRDDVEEKLCPAVLRP